MDESKTKSPDEKYCTECGSRINAKAEICVHCGVRQLSTVSQNTMGIAPNGRSRVVAALLALFLGGIGAHRFYLGKIGTGILYLVFCWTFIPSLIGLIEGLVLLGMSNEEFARQYGH